MRILVLNIYWLESPQVRARGRCSDGWEGVHPDASNRSRSTGEVAWRLGAEKLRYRTECLAADAHRAEALSGEVFTWHSPPVQRNKRHDDAQPITRSFMAHFQHLQRVGL